MFILPDMSDSHTFFEASHRKVCEAYPKTEKEGKNIPVLS